MNYITSIETENVFWPNLNKHVNIIIDRNGTEKTTLLEEVFQTFETLDGIKKHNDEYIYLKFISILDKINEDLNIDSQLFFIFC